MPEAKFPAAHDDVNAAYKWVLANAAAWGGDPKEVALAGESAGGDMAVTLAMAARDAGLQAPRPSSPSIRWPTATWRRPRS